MTIILNGNTKTEYEAQFLRRLTLARDNCNFEETYHIPDHIGEGNVHNVSLLGGIDLKWSDMLFYESSTIDAVVDFSHSEFNFCLEGAGSIEINGKVFKECVSAENVQFLWEYHAKGAAYFPAGQRNRHLNIELTPLFWERMGIDPHKRYGKDYFIENRETGVKNAQVIKDILNCPYAGHIRHLFLEGKTYELLALQFNELEPAQIIRKNRIVSKNDIDAIKEAKRLIDSLLQKPPTLIELSRMVYINDFKLKQGFKQLYKTTVFGYIREKRMHIARNLLERGECNVSQAALVVGYESVPSFIRQFKKTFGCNPGECKPKL
jgi:AraC-like DNA-binding protein